jgi:hypothetical protein
MDIKNIARILYENRTDPDYKSASGRRRILAKHGSKIAKATYETHSKAIKEEIANLHNIEFDNQTRQVEKKELEKLFTQADYINFLKRVIDGEPENQKYPTFKDKLQAAKQASEFFGWDTTPPDTEITEILKIKDGKLSVSLKFNSKI